LVDYKTNYPLVYNLRQTST